MIGKCDFSFRHYFEVLNNVRDSYDYIGPFRDLHVRKKASFIVLRHDVDISLNHALKLAKMESDEDIQSTFFILLHSPFYNALTKKNVGIISKISSLGHEIGLHYDTDFLSKSLKTARKQIKDEARILESIIGKKIISVTQHNPSTTVKLNHVVSGFLNAMDNVLTKNAIYISDSVQNWRKGCMCNHVNKISQFQILTHPIWWQEKSSPLHVILKNIKEDCKSEIDSDFKSLDDLYASYLSCIKDDYN